MSRTTRILTLAALAVVLIGRPAVGQVSSRQGGIVRNRVVLHVNGGLQWGEEAFRRTFGFRAYGEDARFDEAHQSTGGGLLDVGGSWTIWTQLSLGASYTQLSKADSTVLTGRVPHPTSTNAPRTIDPQTLALVHQERATHVFAAWAVPLDEKMTLSLFGGPSFFALTQGVVTGVHLSEIGGPPWPEVRVGDVSSGEFKKNGVGVHAGVDFRYMFTRWLGIGGFVRYSKASVDLVSAEGNRPLDVGGVQSGGGLRVRF